MKTKTVTVWAVVCSDGAQRHSLPDVLEWLAEQRIKALNHGRGCFKRPHQLVRLTGRVVLKDGSKKRRTR